MCNAVIQDGFVSAAGWCCEKIRDNKLSTAMFALFVATIITGIILKHTGYLGDSFDPNKLTENQKTWNIICAIGVIPPAIYFSVRFLICLKNCDDSQSF